MRHALVCGGSKGLGLASALKLAHEGHAVTLLARNQASLDAAAKQVADAGASAVYTLAVDLDDRDGMAAIVSKHNEQFGPINILVNNAGGPPGGPILDVSDEAAFMVPFGRHVMASHRLVRMLLPGMQEGGWGRIVNIISTSVKEPIPGLGVSNTVRGAMASWAKTVSKELPPGITINSVLPGFTDTDRLGELAEARAKAGGVTEESVYQGWADAAPEKRIGRPGELGAAVAFFCSEDAGFIRGTVLAVDGGRLSGI